MCVIIGLPKGTVVPFNSLKNASFNNADGFGLVITNDKKMEVIKKVNPKGNDPEDVQKLLEQYKEHDRFLHLRYATAGEVINDNAHPFTVHNSGEHRIEFMHNGTISSYRPPVGDKRSDTHMFAANFIAPLFERLKEIDPEDPFLSKLIEDQMGSMSRGLLISTIHGPTFLGKWKTIKADGGEDLPVSNDDYFDKEQPHRRNKYDNTNRGPYQGGGHGHGGQSVIPFQPTDGGVKATNAANTKHSAGNIVDIATIDTVSRGRLIDPKEFVDYLETGEGTLTDEAITWFSYLSTFETVNFASKQPEVFAQLFENVVARFADLLADKIELEEQLDQVKEKHEKASKLIAELKFTINELEGGKKNVA